MLKRFLMSAVFVALASLVATAQSTGILRGRVLDAGGAVVPGATVTVSGPSLRESKTVTSDDSGNYVILGLPPGVYQLQAKSGNFAPFLQEDLNLRAGATLTFDVKLIVAGVEQKVDVKADAENTPIIDTSNPEQNLNVSGDFMNRLPLGSRQNWDSVWFLIPGAVTLGRNGPDENIDPQIHGASDRSNVYKLNGFDIGNSFTNQGFTTQFSTDIIQDVQIKTSGVDASTPLGAGGYIDVVTKSGGNEFSGTASFFYQPRKFNWTNVPGGNPLDQQLIQPDVSLGGPIFKNKTWFFLSYRRTYLNQGVPRTAAVLQAFTDNGFAQPNYDLLERNNRFFGKITHQLTKNNVVSFNYLNDRGTIFNSDSVDLGTREATIDITSGGPAYIFSWTSNITSKLLLTTTYGYRKINNTISPNGGNNPSINRYSSTFIAGGNQTGNGLIFQYGNRAFSATGSKGTRDQHELTSDLTYVKDNWFGRHTFQTGLQWKPKTRAIGENIYAESGLVTVDELRRIVDGNVVYTPFHRQFRTPSTGTGNNLKTKVLGFYGQDKWVPHPRLTLSLGVRFDTQSNNDTFNNESFNTWAVGPRVGLAYSATKSNKDVIRASWGRIHDIIYIQEAPPSLARVAGFRDEWDNNFDGVFETVRVRPSRGVDSPLPPSPFLPVASDLHAPFIDEFHAGYTRQLPYKMVFDLSYVNRRFMDPIGEIDTNVIYQNGQFTGYRDPDLEGVVETANLTNSHKRYQALEFSLIRNLGGRFQSFISYTYQKQVEKGRFAYDDINGYLSPESWFENDKLARPHLFRFNASYYLPFRFTIAAIFSLQSGQYSGPLVKDLDPDDPEVAAHGPQIVTDSNGNQFFNPLYTTRRLVGPRSDGQLHAGNILRLNLRFGKEFRFHEGKQSFEANVDFFNITNDATPLFFRFGANNVSSSSFGAMQSSVQSPRGAQLSVRYRF
jgi:hypothetical protein